MNYDLDDEMTELIETYINGNISYFFEQLNKMKPSKAALIALIMTDHLDKDSLTLFYIQLQRRLYA